MSMEAGFEGTLGLPSQILTLNVCKHPGDTEKVNVLIRERMGLKYRDADLLFTFTVCTMMIMRSVEIGFCCIREEVW